MDSKEAYQKKLEAKLDEWRADLDKLKAKAELAEADARVRYLQQVEMLEREKRELEEKLLRLRERGNDAWEELKGGLDSAWDDLSEAISKARSQFK